MRPFSRFMKYFHKKFRKCFVNSYFPYFFFGLYSNKLKTISSVFSIVSQEQSLFCLCAMLMRAYVFSKKGKRWQRKQDLTSFSTSTSPSPCTIPSPSTRAFYLYQNVKKCTENFLKNYLFVWKIQNVRLIN